MDGIIAIFILSVIFSPALYWLKRRFDLKELQLKRGENADNAPALEAWTAERRLLVERIQNLEDIVCNTDYELNMRIAQLSGEKAQSANSPPAALPTAGHRPGSISDSPANPPLERAPSLSHSPASQSIASPSMVSNPGGSLSAVAPQSPSAGPMPLQSLPLAHRPTLNASSSMTATSGRIQEQAEAVRAVASAPASLQIGTVLADRYRIERLLGRGGMGVVYLARDEVLNEEVALKLISATWFPDHNTLIERFRREVSAARKVSSTNVIRIHDLGEAPGGLFYLSMEYVAGQTLAEILHTQGRLDRSLIRTILVQICDGLSAAHQAGVIHRDLKPQNVIVGQGNQVKIIDFGLAKIAMSGGATATGLLLGTPYYMSPEQARGKETDARSDIYSLGALAYHAVTGKPPFEGTNPIAVSFAHLSEPVIAPRELVPDISPELNHIIISALAKEPRDRPQSAAEFRRALHDL